MKTLQELTRPNIWNLKPYSSARNEYQGKEATVFLDANENPYNGPYNRYPDPLQRELKALLAPLKKVRPECIFLGNGSDEGIDLVFRAFCEPRIDNVVAIDPTYGMYAVCAAINDVEYRRVFLNQDYQFEATKLLDATDTNTKVIFLCSPNNPTGNLLDSVEMEKVLTQFTGIVVVDEAYIDFSCGQGFATRLEEFPNLILLQTFSKAWGSAGIRLGMAFASPEIVSLFNKIKYPYNINQLTQQQGLEILRQYQEVDHWVQNLINERKRLMDEFSHLTVTEKIYPTDANFFLAKVSDAQAIYDFLVDRGVIVRNRSSVALCKDCLRVTVGTPEENNILLETLLQFTGK